MPKYFSKTWWPVLRFPAIFGGVLIAISYGAFNYKALFNKSLEEAKERRQKLSSELIQRSKDSKEKEQNDNLSK